MTRRYGLDVTLLLGQPTGIGRLVERLVEDVPPLLGDDETLVLLARTFRLNPLLGVSHAPLERAARHPRVALVRAWAPSRLVAKVPVETLAGELDVVHGTAAALPATRTAAGVVTVHDLGPLRRPQDVALASARRFRRGVEDAVRRAARVVAVSEFTARELVELLGVPRDRIEVIPPGVGPEFGAPGDQAADSRIVEARCGPGPYVLCVATSNARKNLPRLVAAFTVARRGASLPHRLVLVGDRGDGEDALAAALALTGDAVRRVGYVDDRELPALYRGAAALAFPSLHEGFGLPVLESMAAGCPVVTSSTSSLPEVAGGAALLVDPESESSISEGLVRVLTDGALRARLVEAGRRRAAQCSWADFAPRHLALWRSLASRP